MHSSRRRTVGLLLAVALLGGSCSPNLKEVKSTLEDSATVGIAYHGHSIEVLDTSIEGRLAIRPDIDVPDAYRAVGQAVRDVLRRQAPNARVDLIDPDSETARAAADVLIRVNVDGAYLCEGGLAHRQTCVLYMQAQLLIQDRRSGTNTPLDYDIARRSAEIPNSENWATISLEQAVRSVPPASLAGALADEVRQDLDALLSEPRG